MVFMVWLWIFDLWIPKGTKTFGCGFVHKHCDHMFRSGTLACTMLYIFMFCSQKCLMSFIQMLCLIKAQFKSITRSKNEFASYWLYLLWHWQFCCFMPLTDLRTVSSLKWLLGEMNVTWSAVPTSSVLGAAVHSNTLPFDQLVNSIPHESTASLISLGGPHGSADVVKLVKHDCSSQSTDWCKALSYIKKQETAHSVFQQHKVRKKNI